MMPVVAHLTELRKRLVYSIIALAGGFAICWSFARDIYDVLMQPLVDVLGEGRKLIFTAPAEAFVTYMKVALIAGGLLAAPVIMWQIWRFVAPGLYRRERAYFAWVVLFGSLFFVGGALFGYLIVFPIGFRFFINTFETPRIEALITLRDYLRFASQLLFAFGLAFELPVFVFFLARVGLVTPQWLWKNFRFAVLIIFVAAAIFTPPDVISQLVLGVPLTLLYVLAVGAAYVFGPRKGEGDKAEKDD
ncbi:twin-arginine translocase subunit TatC [bacterium]|nr:twin-arginine translocase subunit TatC [bacterium]